MYRERWLAHLQQFHDLLSTFLHAEAYGDQK